MAGRRPVTPSLEMSAFAVPSNATTSIVVVLVGAIVNNPSPLISLEK